MTPGAIVAIAVAAVFVGLLAFGFWCDPIHPWLRAHFWRWVEENLWKVEQDRTRAELADCQRTVEELEEWERLFTRAAVQEAYDLQELELQSLPEIEPIRPKWPAR